MTGFLWAALGVLGGLGMTAIGDMLSEEVRDRLDHVPHAILRLAARRLDPKQHAALYEEAWLPDLAYFLKGDEARPVTRLFHGTRFALGILVSARRIACHPDRTTAATTWDEAAVQLVRPGNMLLRLPQLSGCSVGDEIRPAEHLGDGKIRFGGPAFEVIRVIGEHEWLVQPVRPPSDAFSQSASSRLWRCPTMPQTGGTSGTGMNLLAHL